MDTFAVAALLRAARAQAFGSLELWPDQSAQAWRDAPREAFAAWLANQRVAGRPYRVSSAQTYTFIFETWLRALEGRQLLLEEAGADVAQAFFAQEALDPVSRLRYLQLLDRVYQHLASIGVTRKNPAAALLLELGFAPQSQPESLTDEELARLIAAAGARTGSWKAVRDRAILALAAGAGLSAGELLSLPAGPAPWDSAWRIALGRVTVRREHVTQVLAAGPWRAWLLDWEQCRARVCPRASHYLFATARGGAIAPFTLIVLVREALTRAGLAPTQSGARLLRNTFARVAARSLDAATLTECLGHEHPQATDRLLSRLHAPTSRAL